ncbi:MAG: hypothetical protein MO853_05745 [Candidatus Protistobacter heckmanni]|nr:hypothetical protein [Candidatus Protistobacter heckmanni]
MDNNILTRLRHYDHALLQEAANEIQKLRSQLDFLAGQEFDERNFVAMRSKLEVWKQQIADARKNGEAEAASLLRILGYTWEESRWRDLPKPVVKKAQDVTILHVSNGGKNMGISLSGLQNIGYGDHVLYAQNKS